MNLRHAYAAGYCAAFQKLALSPPTQVDEFVANVESGKDVPPDASTNVPQEPPSMPVQEPDPHSLGSTVGVLPDMKQAALGLKDMLFFEKMLGPDEARSMFHSIQQQMSGQGGGTHGTLEIGPQGKTLIPRPKPQLPMPGRGATPPPIPAAALKR